MKKIFIIHGWTYTTSAWDAFAELLRRRGFEPIQLHVPGLTEASSEAWTIEKYLEWLSRELAGEPPATIIGHSNGGRIAIAFAAKYPERVSQLVLIDAAGVMHHEFWLEVKRSVMKTIAKAGKTVTRSPLIRKIFYRLIGARDYERASVTMRATMKNLIEHDSLPELSQISASTLVIWGARDKATPVSDAYVIHSAIKDSKLEVIQDAAHSPHATHPEAVAALVSEWLAKAV